jgi:hypothetical protein
MTRVQLLGRPALTCLLLLAKMRLILSRLWRAG